MKKIYSGIAVLLFTCTMGWAQDNKDYLDASLPIEARVQSLVSNLTLEEKAQQMMDESPAIERLGIPAYFWWNESLHGVARAGVATVFPQAIGLAATFDETLLYNVATAISDEARAMHKAATDQGYHKKYGGLTFWTPNVNIFRDARWGRGQETYGEDPLLTSRLGVAFVNGLQGDNPDYLKIAACAKHYAVHSGPERLRHEFDAQSSMKDLHETYLPAFKALVDAGVESVMCAYNATNGEPCCTNDYLLNDVLRGDWNFKGHVVSDCEALVDLFEGHGIVPDAVEAAAIALKSGVNLNCGSVYETNLVKAVERGLITEEEIDAQLAILLTTRFKLGMFDPEEDNPYNDISVNVINSQEHRDLSRKAAEQSIVLLKNDGVLPLQNDLAKYFVTGPNAASIDALLGNYYGVNPQMVTILEGLAGHVAPGSQIQYRPGIMLDKENLNPIDWTTGNAKDADATIVVLGITGVLEGEEGAAIASADFGDRLDYDLPKHQIDFLKKLKNGHDKPVIAVIIGGSPVNLSEVHEVADAVLMAWYPGQEGGNALAKIIYGAVSPSGKLPITFPKSFEQLPDYEDYSMQGRTYRYMQEAPMYPFGFGLSYTAFDYEALNVKNRSLAAGESLEVTATIKNTGEQSGDEVLQLYLSAEDRSEHDPIYSMKAFKRISLEPGESTNVTFTVPSEDLRMYNEAGEAQLKSGTYSVTLSSGAPTQRNQELGANAPLQQSFEIK